MEQDDERSRLTRFILTVALVAACMIAIAGVVASRFELSFGLTALLAGIIVAGIGSWLAIPDPEDYQNPRNKAFFYFWKPYELASDQIAYDRAHSAPRFGFESVMVWAGLVVVVLGIVLLVIRI